MKIIISPFANKLKNGKENPKNYPIKYWNELIEMLEKLNCLIVQIGIDGEEQLVSDFRKNLTFEELEVLLNECDTFISIDSFFPHFAWSVGKPGIVIWGKSNPKFFGHPENINILKDEKYLRPDQWRWWEQEEYNQEVFVGPEVVYSELLKFISNDTNSIL